MSHDVLRFIDTHDSVHVRRRMRLNVRPESCGTYTKSLSTGTLRFSHRSILRRLSDGSDIGFMLHAATIWQYISNQWRQRSTGQANRPSMLNCAERVEVLMKVWGNAEDLHGSNSSVAFYLELSINSTILDAMVRLDGYQTTSKALCQ